MKKIDSRPAGLFTILSLSIIIAALTQFFDGWRSLFNLVPEGSNVYGTVLAIILVEVFVVTLASLLVSWKFRGDPQNSIADFINDMQGKFNFFAFFVPCLLEEILARWFFLGILPQQLNPTPLVWWTLLISGNLLWSLLHLFNFTHPKDRQWLLILPQFIAGLFFSFVFIKFGFWATVYCHLGCNALILSLHKIEDLEEKDIKISIYCLFVMIASCIWFLFQPRYFSNVFSLIQDQSIFEEYKIFDWVAFCGFILFGLKFIATLLLFDSGMVKEDGEEPEVPTPLQYVLGVLLLIIAIAGVVCLISIFTPSVPAMTLVASMAICALFRTNSGSGVSRNFWIGMPTFFLLISVFQVVEFYVFALCLACLFVLYLFVAFFEREEL